MRLSRRVWTGFGIAVCVVCYGFIVCAGVGSMKSHIEKSRQQINAVESDPLERYRTARQQLRAMEKAQLNEIAYNSEGDSGLSDMARRMLIELCACEEAELTIEGVLQMRGWEDCVATVHEGSVNILIRTDMLTQQESSVIMELACRETGEDSGNVKIIPIN